MASRTARREMPRAAGSRSGEPTLSAQPAELVAAATALAERASRPAVFGAVRFGTAGWADRSLIASGFYPKGASTPQGRLGRYARQFSMVEVDATYHALIGADTVARWVDWTPGDFVFDVKAHPVFTGHPIDAKSLPSDLQRTCREQGLGQRFYAERAPPEIVTELEQRFRASLEPLIEASRLASVLMQFPPWFQATRANAARLERLSAKLPGVLLSVEFRHKSWLSPDRRERVLALLRAQGLALVCVDEPASRIGAVPLVVEVTHPALSVMRFHGQNTKAWDKRGASVAERFNYLYSPTELGRFVEPVARLAEQAQSVHAVFNNCVRNYAVLNAKGLAALLESGQ
jgi:uncharacterized protein YecE (DUF72 family)